MRDCGHDKVISVVTCTGPKTDKGGSWAFPDLFELPLTGRQLFILFTVLGVTSALKSDAPFLGEKHV